VTPTDRARELLAETALFDELGLVTLAAKSRCVAGDVIEQAEALEAERSVRMALQERAEQLQEIVGKGAYYGAIASAAHEAQATMIAKREIERLHTAAGNPPPIEWPDNVVPLARRGAGA
jgi:hypothetical protein